MAAEAPDFSLDGRGAQVNLSALRGKYVYLDFWASWCAPCKKSFPWMGALQQRFGAAGLQVVAINVDTRRSDADQFLAAMPAAFTVAFDPTGATPKKYAIKGMPSSVLIDPAGKIIATHTGFTLADLRLAGRLRQHRQSGTVGERHAGQAQHEPGRRPP